MALRVSSLGISLLLGCCLLPSVSAADTAPVPACTLADINDALAKDLSCSTDGTVFFGTDVNQFIINQCSGLTNPGETGDALKQAQLACFKCGKRAWIAFQAAAKAGLFRPTKNGNGSEARIKKLCNISDGGDNSTDPQPPESDALKGVYDQLRLCLPTEGHSTEPAQCLSCTTTVLDSALSSNVITQQKYDVLKKSVQQVCSKPRGGDGDGPRPTPPPPPAATPPAGNLDGYLSAVRSCFATFHTPQHNDPASCVACVAALPADGLDPAKVAYVQTTAGRVCNGSFSGDDGPKPTPAPN